MNALRSIYIIELMIVNASSKIFNKVSVNQKPLQEPFATTSIDRFEERCFSMCSLNSKCFAFLVDEQNPSSLKCLLYDIPFNFMTLVPHAIDSVLYSIVQSFRDCLDWYDAGARETGVYPIRVKEDATKEVRCNMDIEGGGWLVLQHRFDGNVNFHRNWSEYKNGFGSVGNEFWLGNDLIHYFTNEYKQEMLFKGVRFNGKYGISRHFEFHVKDESDLYRIGLSPVVGTPCFINEMAFSTYDRDNDGGGKNCAAEGGGGRGGFWFSYCGGCTINAPYFPVESVPQRKGLMWFSLMGNKKSLKSTELMIRRRIHVT